MSSAGDLRLVSYADLAEAWQVSRRTVQRWILAYEAQGPSVRIRVRTRVRQTNTTRILLRVRDAEAVLAQHLSSPF